ncbi:MAG: zinc-binding dehydrogenase [Planctomycetaceae bacterium]|nr:zinc-binding dehydrogenase [Planctomycetaceae bacterium]MBT4844449.1 zinc-binding dehydrogenase [Planctomycetaceae bacterium]MBT5124664.1 zinc-binding dehydrogenase [Planctomycetaceae bacterium]MBT5597257.1 zinc-binding dehydrogenase [Planctomycetaceae bacterium]MBT5884594.1 zinc-binding dehydrogenase [Planctomycetaceae bacterium]
MYAPRQIRMIDVEEPTLVNSAGGDIIFQPELACLCGSDLLYFEADNESYEPVVGHSLHELIGTVVDTNGEKFKIGDRVLCVPVNQEGLQERFVVTENQAIYVDPRPDEREALLAQPLGTVLFALRRLPNIVDQNVVVVGQGPMGQLWNCALSQLGARRVIGLDLNADRLKVSPEMGATDTLQVSLEKNAEDIAAGVRSILGGESPDLVIECVGHREQRANLCFEICRKAGTVFFFGVPPKHVENFDLHKMFFKNQTLVTSVGPDFTKDFPLAMRWIAEGRVNVAPIITHHMQLAQIQEAFDLFSTRQDKALKVFLDFPASANNVNG